MSGVKRKQVWLSVVAGATGENLDIFQLEIKKQLFDSDLVHIFVGRLLEAQDQRNREDNK